MIGDVSLLISRRRCGLSNVDVTIDPVSTAH